MTINTTLEFEGAAPNNAVLQRVLNSIAAAITGVLNGSLPGSILCPNVAPGAYTLANSGVVFQTPTGEEIFRLWGTDPDLDDYNSHNLYIGYEAGLNQTTNNVDSAFSNTGVGAYALQASTSGRDSAAFGASSCYNTTSGYELSGCGAYSLYENTTGFGNVGIGWGSGSDLAVNGDTHKSKVDNNMVFIGTGATRGGSASSVTLTNGIAIGFSAIVDASNRAVIGNSSVTDVYFGSSTAAATVHAAGYAVGATAGINASITTAALVGKTITVTNGIITAFA